MSRTVAVTGGTGFIGSHLIDALFDAGHRVRALTRKARADVPGIEWIAGDIADAAALGELLTGAHALIHLAGVVRGAEQSDFDTVNVDGARAVALAARDASVRDALLVSSLAAREPTLSFYARSKRSGEDAFRAAFARAAVFRPPAVYGAGDKELMPLLALMARGIGIHPRHRGRFSLIHVDDLVGAMLAWVGGPDDCADTFELEDGAGGYRWPDVLAAVARFRSRRVVSLGVPRFVLATAAFANELLAKRFHYAPMVTRGKVRELFHPDWVARNEPIRAALGWQPRVGIDAGLRRTLVARTD